MANLSAKHRSLINLKKTCKECGNYGTYQKTRFCYDHFKEYQRKMMNHRRINVRLLGHEHYQEQWKLQGKKCAICGATENNVETQDFSSDHDHITGKLRGVLCHKCNTNVGIIENKGLDYTLNIIDYLKEWM